MTPQQTILSALQQGTLAGSWLITGPEGIGKTLFAKSLAAFLFTGDWDAPLPATNDIKWVSCPLTEEAKKDVQKLLTSGKLVTDEYLATLPRKKIISVDEIRETLRFMALTATGTWRCVIIPDADLMNESAQNALLKGLEEPPKKTVVLLLTKNKGGLLPTILSRCRQIELRPLSGAQMEKYLRDSYPDLTAEQCSLLAFLSQGAVGKVKDLIARQALNLYMELKAFFAPKINWNQALSFIGKIAEDKTLYQDVQHFTLLWLRQAVMTYPDFMPLYDDFRTLFHQTDVLNLDKKQTLVVVFYRIERTFEKALMR